MSPISHNHRTRPTKRKRRQSQSDERPGLFDGHDDSPPVKRDKRTRPTSERKKSSRRKSRPLRPVRGRVVAVDCETTGLDPYTGDTVFCFAYFTDKNEYGFFRKTKESIEWLRKLFDDPTKTIVFHNAKFDLMMFLCEGIDTVNCKARVDCTLTMNKVLNSTSWADNDLESLGARVLGRETEDKSEISDWVKANNKPSMVKARGYKYGFQHAPDEMVRRRALWDVETTIGLWKVLGQQVKNTCPKLYETERRLITVVVDMQHRGVMVDLTRAKKLKAEAQQAMGTILSELSEMVLPINVTKTVKGKKVEVEVDDEFNPKSNKHLEGAFRKLGIELKYKTQGKKDKRTGQIKGGGNWAFDEYAMMRYVSKPLMELMREASEEGWDAIRFNNAVHRVVEEHDLNEREILPPLVLRYNQLSKMVSTYYNAILKKAVDIRTEPNGREVGVLHCRFNPAEAKTGRFSSSGPNLQNIPRLLGPRECFIPRRGYKNWHLDYSQVEMRFFCHFAQDRGMANAIDSDVHQYVATKIYRKTRDKITKEQRKRAKATGFGILYGSGAKTQAETLTKKGLPTLEHEAKTVIAAHHREFPSVRKLTNDYKSQLVRNGYVENPFGRRYYIPPKFGYKALNYMCQGTSADLIKRAMVDCWEWLRDKGYRTRLILTVHDEVVFEVPPAEAKVVIPKLKAMMERLDEYFVPIKVEAELSTHRWSNKKDPVKDFGYKWAA